MAGRFSFSSPESRPGSDPWFRIGQVDVTTTVLVVGLCVLSLFVWAIDETALLRLALLPDDVRSGQIWRIVTWPFYNELDSIWTVLTIAIFWYFGREIEGRLGRSRFAILLLIMAVVTGLAATILSVEYGTIRPIEFGVFLIFVAGNPYARFFFGIPAWVLGLVFVVIEVLQLLNLRQEDRILLLFITIATALIAAKSMGLAEATPWIPAVPWGRGSGGGGNRRRRPARRKPPRGGGGVVAGPWAAPGGGRAAGPLPQPPGNGPTAQDHAELDALLDKISAGGLDALSAAEKKRLNELSKRMRGSR